MPGKFIKYITRDYSLRDRSITVSTLFLPGVIKEILYTAVIEYRHDNVVDVYIRPEDSVNNTKRLEAAIASNTNFIEEGLIQGIKSTKRLLNYCSKEVGKITKKEAIKKLEEAKNEFQDFSSFLEFTHRIGSMGRELTPKQIVELSDFHEMRKNIFLDFFGFLDKVCLAATVEDTVLEQKDLRFLLLSEIHSYLNGEISVKEINEMQARRIKSYVYENYNLKQKVTDTNVEAYWQDFKEKYVQVENTGLKGVPVNKGKIIGEVMVVNQSNYADFDLKDKVVVISMTTTSMNTALKGIKAIVTEEGGLLCHAAIFSREFDIITLTQVKNVTNILKTGDMVEVDADSGVVKII